MGTPSHTLVWVASSFGVGISVGGLTLYDKLHRLEFFGVGLACLFMIYVCYRLAEGNRIQWINCWHVLNDIEGRGGFRDRSRNPNGPLAPDAPNAPSGVTRRARGLLMWTCAVAWVFAIVLKVIRG